MDTVVGVKVTREYGLTRPLIVLAHTAFPRCFGCNQSIPSQLYARKEIPLSGYLI